MKSICFYGSASTGHDPYYCEQAYRLAACLAREGYAGINGAGADGMMRATTDGFLDNGGSMLGIIPQFMADRHWTYPRLQEHVLVTATMHERKQAMADRSDITIALPGGCGTLDELLEIITWKQLGLYHGAVIILNLRHFFDPLLQMLANCTRQGFMPAPPLWHTATTVEQCLETVRQQQPHL